MNQLSQLKIDTILEKDKYICQECGEKINIIDIFIASIALSNDLTVVSLDNDFGKIPNLKVLLFK